MKGPGVTRGRMAGLVVWCWASRASSQAGLRRAASAHAVKCGRGRLSSCDKSTPDAHCTKAMVGGQEDSSVFSQGATGLRVCVTGDWTGFRLASL